MNLLFKVFNVLYSNMQYIVYIYVDHVDLLRYCHIIITT